MENKLFDYYNRTERFFFKRFSVYPEKREEFIRHNRLESSWNNAIARALMADQA